MRRASAFAVIRSNALTKRLVNCMVFVVYYNAHFVVNNNFQIRIENTYAAVICSKWKRFFLCDAIEWLNLEGSSLTNNLRSQRGLVPQIVCAKLYMRLCRATVSIQVQGSSIQYLLRYKLFLWLHYPTTYKGAPTSPDLRFLKRFQSEAKHCVLILFILFAWYCVLMYMYIVHA